MNVDTAPAGRRVAELLADCWITVERPAPGPDLVDQTAIRRGARSYASGTSNRCTDSILWLALSATVLRSWSAWRLACRHRLLALPQGDHRLRPARAVDGDDDALPAVDRSQLGQHLLDGVPEALLDLSGIAGEGASRARRGRRPTTSWIATS